MAKFQSYLVLGNSESTSEKTAEIARELGISILKTSPDVQIIKPEKSSPFVKKSHILIDQIRELKKTIYQKPVVNSFKLVIVKQTEKMTIDAQNSLLKIFEEPPAQVVIILTAQDKSKILPTIVSRAVTIQTVEKYSPKEEISSIIESDITQLLIDIGSLTDPNTWLKEQMLALHQKLLANIKSGNYSSLDQIQSALIHCSQAKKMIDANVSPKFVLANLIFSLKPNAHQ